MKLIDKDKVMGVMMTICLKEMDVDTIKGMIIVLDRIYNAPTMNEEEGK